MRIKTVFIDTSIFEANNFFEGKRISELLKLSEQGYINIIMPKITYMELLNRGNKNLNDAFVRYAKYRDDMRSLRNLEPLKDRFAIINPDDFKQSFKELVDEKLLNAKVEILEYPKLEIARVFDKYFQNEFPFNKKDKKHEFPDAFTVECLEEWCNVNGRRCLVLTTDKDLLNYKSANLVVPESYESYLDELIKQIEVEEHRDNLLDQVHQLYNEHKNRLEAEIKNWLYEQLQDIEIYIDWYNVYVHSFDIRDYEVELSEFKYVSISEIDIDIEVQAKIHYKVEVEVDDEDSTRYYDDRSWSYEGTLVDKINSTQMIPVLFKIQLPKRADEKMEMYLEYINNGNGLSLK